MAQTGFTPILTYASGTASNVPLAANLTSSASGAELALNYADGRLFYKDSGGVVQVLATKATGSIGGSTTQVQYNLSGALAGSANMTFNGTRLTVADLADSGLTAGRVTYASSGGALVDSANLLFDGTTLTANALTTTSTVTINGGTANGVAYLNGSKVLTTGSALTFDGTLLATTGNISLGAGANLTWGGAYGAGIPTIAGSSGAFLFYPNGSTSGELMRLNSSGNLGLGVTPSAWTVKAVEIGAKGTAIWNLNQQNASFTCNAYYDGTLRYGGTGLATQYQQAAGIHCWYTAASGTAGNAITFTQAMTLDASGNLGVGTTNPQRLLHLNGPVGSMRLEGSSVGGYIEIVGPSNTNYIGTPAAISLGSTTDLAFFLSGSERARITSGGDLLVGTTTATSNIKLKVDNGGIYVIQPNSVSSGSSTIQDSSASPNTLRLYNNTDSNNGTQRFLICDAAAAVVRAEIRSNGGIANYSGNNVNLSDRREKTNFAPAKSYLDTICAIPVQTFNYIDQSEDDPGLTLGVVAQDVQAVAPELVMESNWGNKENPRIRLSVYQTDLQYALMKCIQEQQALITSLTARITTLEAK
jgi:hypothetical protein